MKCLAYKILCRPKLEYAVEVWDPFLTKHVDLLEMLQNRAVHFICDIRGRNGVSDTKKLLNLDLLAHRRKHSRMIMTMISYILQATDIPFLSELHDLVTTN